MEFQKERCFTALDADELKVGSKIIVSDCLSDLKNYIENEEPTATLKDILCEDKLCRFDTGAGAFALAYLVSEPGEKKLKWSDLKPGDIIRHKTLKVEHLITGIHYGSECVFFDGDWANNETLEEWEKVEE